jgi:sialate O-acetylesterase
MKNLLEPKSVIPPMNLPIRVTNVGDSITERSSYASDLQTLLGANYSVSNFGVSGSTVTLNSYLPYMQQPQFQRAENYQPNIVVIMLGTNDAHSYLEKYNETFEQDYTKLTHAFQELDNKPQIFIVESPPVFNNSLDLDPTFFSSDIIPHIQNVANTQNIPTVDVYDAFGNHSDYTQDGIHPTDEGATLIASEVYNAINPQDDSSTNNSAP